MRLFKQITIQGGQFHAASQALVYEHVESHRARLGWLLKRFYRGGIVYGRVRYHRPLILPAIDAVVRAVKIAALALKGLAKAPLGRSEDLIRALATSALLAGGINAWLRPQRSSGYVEYKTKESEAA